MELGYVKCVFPPGVGNEFNKSGTMHLSCLIPSGRKRLTFEQKYPEKKICSKCEIEKHIIEFYFDASRGHYGSWCKCCHRESSAKYRIEFPDKWKRYIKEYNKTYKRKK